MREIGCSMIIRCYIYNYYFFLNTEAEGDHHKIAHIIHVLVLVRIAGGWKIAAQSAVTLCQPMSILDMIAVHALSRPDYNMQR